MKNPSEHSSPTALQQAETLPLWPAPGSALRRTPEVEQRIDELLGRMSLEEKIGQMIMPEIKQVTPDDVRDYHLGSVFNGGGTVPNNNKYARAEEWVALADSFFHASIDTSGGRTGIPIVWGTDAVHGLGNVIGATLFPHNIALGATGNPELIEQIGEVTAREIAATGLDWNFSPTVAVARDDRWGRTYESYAEDPELVADYAARMVAGLQGGASGAFQEDWRVIATAKHFIGDGGTHEGVDRGNNTDSETRLRDIHGAGYFSALRAGVQAVMASFNSWRGVQMHGHRYLLTDVLKGQMGFDGVVIGDWNGHSFIPGCTALDAPAAVNAGLDIYMIPDAGWRELYRNTLRQAREGIISPTRVDDAVRRMLRVKLRAGLFEKGAPSTRRLAARHELLGAPEHREVARQAVRESLVLLKNRDNLLPLSPRLNVLVTGDGANSLAKQCGGWSVTWQGIGNPNSDFPGATTVYEGIRERVSAAGGSAILSESGAFETRPDVAIVVFGEEPYAEMQGDVRNLQYKPGDQRDLELLKRLRAQNIPVVALFITGRPLWINRELNQSDAFVVIWQPGTEGGGVADVIFSADDGSVTHDMRGRLSFSWPKRPDQYQLNRGDEHYDPLFPYGYGLAYGERDLLGDHLPEEGVTEAHSGEVLELFYRRPMTPWEFTLEGNVNDRVNMTGNHAAASTVSAQAVDREVQEDARRVVWNGRGRGAVSLAASTPQDLTPYLAADACLILEIKVDRAPTAALALRVACGPSCASDIDVTERLGALAGQGWKTVTIALGEFPNAGSNFGLVLTPRQFFDRVTAPFCLITAGELEVTLGRVRIAKPGAE